MKKRSVEQAFSEAAPEYDTWVKQALPTYDELFSVAVEIIPFAHDRPLEIADLGAGSGLFTRHVQSAYPNAAFTLVDASREMLELARKRFQQRTDSFSFIEQRLEDFSEPERFDVVISSLAIHHLEDADKRSLFKRIFNALRPGGAFIHVDQIRVPVLIAQGGKDSVINRAESDQIVEALKKRGVPVEYILKEDEGHGYFQNKKSRLELWEAIDKFLKKYISK